VYPLPVAVDTTGTFATALCMAEFKCLTAMHKFYEPADWKVFAEAHAEAQEYIAVSAGTSEGDFKTITQVLDLCPGVNKICLDVANGYSEHFIDHVRKVREAFPSHTIMAGNVVTGEMVEELLLSGADIVKVCSLAANWQEHSVRARWPDHLLEIHANPALSSIHIVLQVGIGPGSVCTTRRQTGVGYPQLSAILECADAAHGLNGHIVGDGGCTCPGDIAKAFGGGSDFVMLGGMLAGHDQSGGELVERGGNVSNRSLFNTCTCIGCLWQW
jgi:GMP reductase